MEKGTPTLGSLHLFDTEAAIACPPCNFPVPSIPSPTGGSRSHLVVQGSSGPKTRWKVLSIVAQYSIQHGSAWYVRYSVECDI